MRGSRLPGSAERRAALDYQESYLRAIFGFFGITDIAIVRAEGVAMGEEARGGAIDAARTEIDRLAA